MIPMKNPAIFGFYGESDTGKTSLIEQIIKTLVKDGYNVATIKNTNKETSIDDVGKDTWKHSSAGAMLVVLSTPVETDFIVKDKISTKDIVQIISEFGYYNVILIEGARDSFIPKIRIGTIKKRDNTIMNYQNNFKEIYKIIEKEIGKDIDVNKIQVRINKKAIPLSEFPTNFIKNTIIGMMKSLKGVDKISDIEIRFKV
jgi:molybdopterin-guanine dinucleotide biosynthesis protein B